MDRIDQTCCLLQAASQVRFGAANYWIGIGRNGDVCCRGRDLIAVLQGQREDGRWQDLSWDCQGAILFGVYQPTIDEVIAAGRAGITKIVYALPGPRTHRNGLPVCRRNGHATKAVLQYFRKHEDEV